MQGAELCTLHVQYIYEWLLAGSEEATLPCEDAHEPLCAVEHGVQLFPGFVRVRGEFGLLEGRRGGGGGEGGEGEMAWERAWGERVIPE